MKCIISFCIFSLMFSLFAVPVLQLPTFKDCNTGALSPVQTSGNTMNEKYLAGNFDLLEKHGLNGTFFLNARTVLLLEAQPEHEYWQNVRKVSAAGNEIGINFQYHHAADDYDFSNAAAFAAELNSLCEIVKKNGNSEVKSVTWNNIFGRKAVLYCLVAKEMGFYLFEENTVHSQWYPVSDDPMKPKSPEIEEFADDAMASYSWHFFQLANELDITEYNSEVIGFFNECLGYSSQKEELWIAPFREIQEYSDCRKNAYIYFFEQSDHYIKFMVKNSVEPDVIVPLTVELSGVTGDFTISSGNKNIDVRQNKDGGFYFQMMPGEEGEVKFSESSGISASPFRGMTICHFYGDKAGALTFSFDDNGADRMGVWAPLLQEFNIPGSFNFIGRNYFNSAFLKKAHEIVATGSEVGVHSYSHNLKMSNWNDDAIREEVIKAKEAIEQLGFDPITFCYPSNYNTAPARRIVGEYFPLFVGNERISHNTDDPALTGNIWADDAVKFRKWLVIMVHNSDFYGEQKIYNFYRDVFAHSASLRDVLWVDSFKEIKQYSLLRNSANIVIESNSGAEMLFSLQIPESLKWSKRPLTIHFFSSKLPQKVEQSNHEIEIESIPGGFLLNRVIPGEGVRIVW